MLEGLRGGSACNAAFGGPETGDVRRECARAVIGGDARLESCTAWRCEAWHHTSVVVGEALIADVKSPTRMNLFRIRGMCPSRG